MPGTPDKIKQLTETFNNNIDYYKSASFNETQLRREFIDPFFSELGWDVENKHGYAEAYKDVIHEYSLKTKDLREAPDYCFRIGGTRKFFIEAKKPSVNLKEDIHPAFQLRRYAWSAKLPLSILTDFEEFAVYDCRIPPRKNDKASTGRIIYYNYKDYISKWDEIESVFSREAILKGSFDKYAETNKNKRGTAEVDETFLKVIEGWREFLARNIALRNSNLTTRELNYAVQKTIDRIIFLRICEDRGIEEYGQIMNLMNGANVYKRLTQIFTRADEKYNSGLFHFEVEKERAEGPDEITPHLEIDDKVLKEIIKNLYYPESPFEFSVLPSDILGQVYEQFLGKVIRLTEAHHAVIDDKPEVKKAGGVYYTPTYIVKYIVENTLGKILSFRPEGEISSEELSNALTFQTDKEVKKALKKVSGIKVLDPACGSGSFLLEAYQYLLDWHLKTYTTNTETLQRSLTGKNPQVYQASNGDYRLTTAERKRILLNNIYGVDIDSQAVEVTKLSLLLKVLEGESEESLNSQIKMFHERALPDLGNNIKCGNSLIGPDFYDQMEMNFLDDEEKLRINVFDWNTEFKDIMNNGGFDVVIGNPPWGAEFSKVELRYLKDKNKSIIVRMIDSYMYFINLSFNIIKAQGVFGMIIPSTFNNQSDMRLLRSKLIESNNINTIINLGEKVFGAKVLNTSTILIFNVIKEKRNNYINVNDLRQLKQNEKIKKINNLKNISYEVWKKLVKADGDNIFFSSRINELTLFNGIKDKFIPLNDIIDGQIQRGISPDYKDAFVIDKDTVVKSNIEKEILKPIILGKHISRYKIPFSTESIIYITHTSDINKYPNSKIYLSKFRDKITCKEVKEGKHPWFSLHRARNPEIFLSPKFIGLTTTKKLCLTIDNDGYFVTDALYVFKLNKNYNCSYFEVLGILHSKVFQFLYDISLQGENRVIPQIKATNLYKLPFPIKKSNDKDKTIFMKIEKMVKQLFEMNDSLDKLKTPQEKTTLQRQIETTDKQIDQLVYQLYGLTEEEIKIVEEE